MYHQEFCLSRTFTYTEKETFENLLADIKFIHGKENFILQRDKFYFIEINLHFYIPHVNFRVFFFQYINCVILIFRNGEYKLKVE